MHHTGSETRAGLCAEIEALQKRAEIEGHLEVLGVDAIDLAGAAAKLDDAKKRLRAYDAQIEAAAFADALREEAAVLAPTRRSRSCADKSGARARGSIASPGIRRAARRREQSRDVCRNFWGRFVQKLLRSSRSI
jgi:hypothetical protein